MPLRYLLLLNCFIFGLSRLHSQQSEDTLAIGEKAGNIEFRDIINFSKATTKLEDFKGKPVILDFWATWCAACIAAMPKMQELQKEFQGKMQFMLISGERKAIVETFLNKMRKSKSFDLPSAIDTDYQLSKKFNVRFVPHYVWIDADGTIRAVTGPHEVTQENIQALINREELNLNVKTDEQRLILETKYPLLIDSNWVEKTGIVSYSLLTGHIKGTSAMMYTPDKGEYAGRRILATRNSISNLYRKAYGDGEWRHMFPPHRTILEVADKDKYIPSNALPDSIRLKRLYCYDLIIPENDSAKLYSAMQSDLQRHFGLKARVDIEMMKCLVLKKDGTDKLRPASSVGAKTTSGPFQILLYKQPLSRLVELLNWYNQTGLPDIIDETGSKINADIEINGDLKELTTLNKELSKYGLILIETEKPFRVLILSE